MEFLFAVLFCMFFVFFPLGLHFLCYFCFFKPEFILGVSLLMPAHGDEPTALLVTQTHELLSSHDLSWKVILEFCHFKDKVKVKQSIYSFFFTREIIYFCHRKFLLSVNLLDLKKIYLYDLEGKCPFIYIWRTLKMILCYVFFFPKNLQQYIF